MPPGWTAAKSSNALDWSESTPTSVEVVLPVTEFCEMATRPFWMMRAVTVAPVVSSTRKMRTRLLAPLARLIGCW